MRRSFLMLCAAIGAMTLAHTVAAKPPVIERDPPAAHKTGKVGKDETCSRCEGDNPCSACTNCSRCAHCSSGGTCGVCAPGGSGSSRGSGSGGRSSYTVPDPIPAPTPRPKPTPDPNAFHGLTAQRTKIAVPEVGMRKAAKDDSTRLRLLHKGDPVTVLGAQSGHYKIMLADGKTGFVPKRAVAWVSGL